MIEGVSGELVGLLAQAGRAALRRGQTMSTAHAVLTLLEQDKEVSRVLQKHGVREAELLRALKHGIDEPDSALELAIERADKIARTLGSTATRGIHLILAISREPRSSGYRCLAQLGLDNHRLEQAFIKLLARPSDKAALQLLERKPIRAAAQFARAEHSISREAPKRSPLQPALPVRPLGLRLPKATSPQHRQKTSILASIGHNLTAALPESATSPISGRAEEIDRILSVLCRKDHPNPVLVGEAGVGKTTLAKSIAYALRAQNATPRATIIELRVSALISGTGIRGAVAERIRKIEEEISNSIERIILFVDDCAPLLRNQDNNDELVTSFRAMLDAGKVQFIGTMHTKDFQKMADKEPALLRHVTRIDIEEPSPSAALEMIRSVIAAYERHHGVRFAEECLTAAVSLSSRYIADEKLPDKALNVLDIAASHAARLKAPAVEIRNVASVISARTGISEERLLMLDGERFLQIEQALEKHIVGQEKAVHRIAQALRKSALGFHEQRPLGTFLLVGPTGVGKTETVKLVSDWLFGPKGLTRFDMSEFSEPHAIARLLGAPPGYIGHDEGGQLTDAVRKRPYQVILFDEIEKAHPDVLLMLLPLLDEGRLTDSHGRTVSFAHTVIFMTSNLGIEEAAAKGIGFNAAPGDDNREERVLASVKRALPPELWNRIDEPTYFRALNRSDAMHIASRMLHSLGDRLLREKQLTLQIDDGVTEQLTNLGGFDSTLGARPMRRCIATYLEQPLAKLLLEGKCTSGDRIIVSTDHEHKGIHLLVAPQS